MHLAQGNFGSSPTLRQPIHLLVAKYLLQILLKAPGKKGTLQRNKVRQAVILLYFPSSTQLLVKMST